MKQGGPSFYLSGCIFGIVWIVFGKFLHGTRKPYEVVTEPDFLENYFCPQNWENGPKMGQNLLKNPIYL